MGLGALALFVAVADLLAGCSPTNYDSCIQDASTRPTELGVRVARQQCHEKFKKPAEEAAAAERVREAEKRADAWRALNATGTTLSKAKQVMGQPKYYSDPRPCTKQDNNENMPQSCVAIEWPDESSIYTCGFPRSANGRAKMDIDCYFHAEFESSSDDAKLWALWDKPF